MKYNPKINDRIAALPGFSHVHPLTPAAAAQGALAVLWDLERALGEITGLPAVSLQPAAGAQGELTAMLIARAHHRDRGEESRRGHHSRLRPRHQPGLGAAGGDEDGGDQVEPQGEGGSRGPDGRCWGRRRRRSCSPTPTPWVSSRAGSSRWPRSRTGGGGPSLSGRRQHERPGGPGPAGADGLRHDAPEPPQDLLHPPRRGRARRRSHRRDREAGEVSPRSRGAKDPGTGSTSISIARNSVGRVHGFFGNFGVLVRALTYIQSLGRRRAPRGQPERHPQRQLSSWPAFPRSIRSGTRVRACTSSWFRPRPSRRNTESGPSDISKRLLDHGFHSPTTYFPLIVDEALMIEPTESETLETLDRFRGRDAGHRRGSPYRSGDGARAPPTPLPVIRPDEATAARKPRSSGGHRKREGRDRVDRTNE